MQKQLLDGCPSWLRVHSPMLQANWLDQSRSFCWACSSGAAKFGRHMQRSNMTLLDTCCGQRQNLFPMIKVGIRGPHSTCRKQFTIASKHLCWVTLLHSANKNTGRLVIFCLKMIYLTTNWWPLSAALQWCKSSENNDSNRCRNRQLLDGCPTWLKGRSPMPYADWSDQSRSFCGACSSGDAKFGRHMQRTNRTMNMTLLGICCGKGKDLFQWENWQSEVHTAHAESNSQLQANTFAGLHVYTAQTRVPDG